MRTLTRGYLHQLGFYLSLGACLMLLLKSHGERAFSSNLIYSLSLIALYGISALYHCHYWSQKNYLIMKRIDHAAIFALIAGTATPICMLGMKSELGFPLIIVMWAFAILGMLVITFCPRAPKWLRALIYVALGWLAVPFSYEIASSLGMTNLYLLILGGILYTIGALIYALKRPDPFPLHFGYHEIFHIFVVLGSGIHFAVIYRLSV